MNRAAATATVAKIQAGWPAQWSPARTEVWVDVISRLDQHATELAFVRLLATNQHCPSIAEFTAATNSCDTTTPVGHPRTCMCGGPGWVTITEHDQHGSWEAFTRCPDGPPTAFVDPDDNYDPIAGAAAHATFNALAAKAESRSDLANACFAAATAYRNAATAPPATLMRHRKDLE